MNYKQFLKDYKIKQIEVQKYTGVSLGTLTKMKENNFKGKLTVNFFLCLKKWRPELDFKKYFPEYSEMIDLENNI